MAYLQPRRSRQIIHFWHTRATIFRTLSLCMNVRYIVGKEQPTVFCFGVSCLFYEYSHYFGGGYVNFSIPYNVDGLQLIICACYFCEMALKVFLGVSFANMWNWKGIWEK
jgi:hypothetical protein